MDKDWTRPLMDSLYRPVEVASRARQNSHGLVKLKGGKARFYQYDFTPSHADAEGILDYPQGNLLYADDPIDGWYHFTPVVDGVGPDGVSKQTHEMQFSSKKEGPWSLVVGEASWAASWHYRYRPLTNTAADITTLSAEDLTARIEAGEAAKAELERRGNAKEQAFREALADVFVAAPFLPASVADIRHGQPPGFIAALMARFELKERAQ